MKSKIISYFLFSFTAVASFLFFTIQLTSSKIITPVFGGIAWVWILTMLFYQAVLLAGYFFAGCIKKIKTKNVLLILGMLIFLSSFFVPVPEKWGEGILKHEMIQVLYILFTAVGFPGVMLASSTIILQKAAHSANISPWQLYFYSNIGSLSAIFLYPFVIENLFSGTVFLKVWTALLAILGVIIAVVSFIFDKKTIFIYKSEKAKDKLLAGDIFIWLFYSALPSAFLAMVSAFLTEDIASMPFLWAMPLGIFMFAFSLPFSPWKIIAYKYNVIYFICTGLMIWFIYIFYYPEKKIITSIMVSLLAVFFVTWTYVSGLIKNKPSPEYLQNFYVSLAIGGFLGNFFVSVVSPLAFNSYVERWIISILILVIPSILGLMKNNKYWLFDNKKDFAIQSIAVTIVVIIFFGIAYYELGRFSVIGGTKIDSERSMYGMLTVTENTGPIERAVYLFNGNTLHGYQNLINGILYEEEPSSYYNEDSPLEPFFSKLEKEAKKYGIQNVAVIGLGTGAINYYSWEGIHTTFYEIDKNVEKIARKYFSYLDIAGTSSEVKIGDGRLLLLNEENNKYEMIIIDAFTGVSIPRHLLTSEAVKIYFDKMSEDGVLIVHTSNRYLDINKIVNLSVYENGLNCYYSQNPYSTWVIASKKLLENTDAGFYIDKYEKINELDNKTWTDDFTPIFPFLY